MFRGEMARALAMTGTAVFRILVSIDSMKKATATSQGSIRLMASGEDVWGAGKEEPGDIRAVAAASLEQVFRLSEPREDAGVGAPAVKPLSLPVLGNLTVPAHVCVSIDPRES